MSPLNKIAELRRLLEKATPAPWEVTGWEAGSHGHSHDTVCIGGPNHRAPDYFVTGDIRETDRRLLNHNLIVALRNAAPALLDVVEIAEAICRRSPASDAALALRAALARIARGGADG